VIYIELFIVSHLGEYTVRYTRLENPSDGRNPDLLVNEMLQKAFSEGLTETSVPLMIHSTSWRHENPDTIILTYLAYSEDFHSFGKSYATSKSIQCNPSGMPKETNLQAPRPAQICEEDVVIHGLQHLAFIARREYEKTLNLLLSDASKAFLFSLSPEISGQLTPFPLPKFSES